MVGLKPLLNVGMIGYKFMGKAHTHAYRDVSFYFDPPLTPVLKAISGRDERGLLEAAQTFGFASTEKDWRRLIEREDVDLVDIVTPNHTHVEMIIAAAEAGKHILCEKPLAIDLGEAKKILQVLEKGKAERKHGSLTHMISHNYRFAPAVQLAKRLIEEGRLGRIYHVRAAYLQDWIMDPKYPLVWRLRKEVTGSGALGDIASHSVDLARFLVGEIKEVSGILETFIKERPLGEMAGGLNAKIEVGTGNVDVDDAAAFLARFENGALGVFEATRFAAGNRNKNTIEINGSKGTIRWDFEHMNVLDVYFTEDEQGLQGFRTINVTEGSHPYVDHFWPSGHSIGYEHTFIILIYELLKGVAEGKQVSPSFIDGFMNQAVLEAVERSALERSWVNIRELISSY